MIFQKRARKCTDNFYIGKDVIDLVHPEYTYLGTRISSNGNFNVSELHYNGKNSLYYNLLKISEYFDLPDFDPNGLSKAN